MGIIEKQATRNAIYSYLGAVLGFITLIWASHVLTTDENGLTRVLVSIATLLAQFGNLGFNTVTIKFFPYFKNKEKGHHGFLFYALAVASIGFTGCLIAYYAFQDWIIESNTEKSKLFVDYLFYLMPLTFFALFFNVFDTYLRATYSSVAGSFTKEFLQRIFILIALALYFLKFIDFPVFVFLYIAATCAPTLLLLYFIIKQKEWHVKPTKGFVSKELKNNILKLSFYSILSGGAGAIIVNIDAIMVNQLLGLSKTGVYSIAFYFGTIIIIPARSLYRIASSIISEAFKNDDIEQIKKLYNKSCNTQLTIGAFLFIGIVTNIHNIMDILPPEYETGKNVILIISAGYLVEMATGINQIIIVNSKYYRFDAYFIFLIVAIVIIANLIFIPLYGIAGSAIATALSIALGNTLRYLFLKIKYDMQPYDLNTLKLITISCIVFIIGYYLPNMNHLMLDILLRGSLVTVLFVFLILKFNASPDINSKIRKNLQIIFTKKSV